MIDTRYADRAAHLQTQHVASLSDLERLIYIHVVAVDGEVTVSDTLHLFEMLPDNQYETACSLAAN
jgi:hypothetical protein